MLFVTHNIVILIYVKHENTTRHCNIEKNSQFSRYFTACIVYDKITNKKHNIGAGPRSELFLRPGKNNEVQN